MKTVKELAEMVEARKEGMKYARDEEAIVSLIVSTCRYNLKTNQGTGTWEERHDALAEEILQLASLLQGRIESLVKNLPGE